MEFDEKLSQKSGANAKLEKPFDTETLRNVVNKLVKKTETHPLKGLLNFPTLPDFEETETLIRHKLQNQKNEPEFTIDDDIDDFKPLDLKPLTKIQNINPDLTIETHNIEELTPSASEIHLETENYGEFEEVVLVKSDNESKKDTLENKIQDQLKSYLESSPIALNKVSKLNDSAKKSDLNRYNEQLVREEVRLMAEKICWQIIPDITEKLVREELKKLLTDIEKSV